MDPIRSGISGGIAATIILSIFLYLTDLLIGGTNPFAFTTFLSLCAIGGPAYCATGNSLAIFLNYISFFLLFAVVWALLFAAITWGLPGESGITHGLVFGLVLWTGYAIGVVYDIGADRETISSSLPLLIVTVVGYLLYGLVLGGTYDYLAGHRTFMSQETTG
jgi:hypothetical protein